MSLQRAVVLVIALLLIAAVAARFSRRSMRTRARPPQTHSTQHPSHTPASSTLNPAAAPAPSKLPTAPNTRRTARNPNPLPTTATLANPSPPAFAPPDETAMLEADRVSLMIRDYRTLTGGNPVGTNSEIMAALMGDNPKQAKLGPPEGVNLNEKGELLDRWGTPYFFHQLSRDHMEIRSAGPDKVLWTDDDPVIK